ncbi:MAG: hypothetical protein WC342_07005 [Methanoregula sp.]
MDKVSVSFLAAGLIIGLCVGVFAGVSWLAPALMAPGQGATCPVPSGDSDVDISAAAGSNIISFLFVQESDGGSLVPEKDGTMNLTLTGVRSDTVYFSDKPARISGVLSTGIFNSSTLWETESSPNAALMIPDAPASNDTVILSLSHPRYNRTAATLQYTAVVVPNYLGDGLKAYKTFADPMVPEYFDQAMLFIDSAEIPVTAINTTSDNEHPDIINLS